MHEVSEGVTNPHGKFVNISGVTGNPTDREEYDTSQEADKAAIARSKKTIPSITYDMLRSGFRTSEEHFRR